MRQSDGRIHLVDPQADKRNQHTGKIIMISRLQRQNLSALLCAAAITLAGCTQEDAVQRLEARKGDILATWAEGYRAAGSPLAAISEWGDVAEALNTSAAALVESADALDAQQSAGGYPPIAELSAGIRDLAESMSAAAAAHGRGDAAALGDAVVGMAASFRAAAPGHPLEVRRVMIDGATGLRRAADAYAGAHDPAILAIVDEVLERPLAEYATLAGKVLATEDPEFRRWAGIDDPRVLEGLEQLTTGDGVEALGRLAADPRTLIAGAGKDALADGLARFGNDVVAASSGVGPATSFFLVGWEDECSPEGAKRNCEVKQVNITLCGHSPDDIEKILDFAGKLPFGGVALSASLAVSRLSFPSSIYVQCSFDQCDDTFCSPLGGTDLEWIEHEEWVEIKNEGEDNVGPGDCWAPQVWDGRTRLMFRRKAERVLRQECGC